MSATQLRPPVRQVHIPVGKAVTGLASRHPGGHPRNSSMSASTPNTTAWLRLHGAARLRFTGSDRLLVLERKHAAILAYLWFEGPTPRARLSGLLWPAAAEERARGNLRQRLSKLRQEAGDIVRDERGVLSLAPTIAIDAAESPRAGLLASFEYDDSEAFARWLDGRRESEREQRKRQWLAEVRTAAQSMRLDDALFAADQLLETDRESEEAYRVLMEVFYLRGDHAAAISAWDRCRTMLRELYGVAAVVRHARTRADHPAGRAGPGKRDAVGAAQPAGHGIASATADCARERHAVGPRGLACR